MADIPPAGNDPVNPSATPEARALLRYLYRLSGHKTLTGQHSQPGFFSRYTEKAKEITGRYPAVWGNDFGFTADGMDGIVHRPRVIADAIQQHEAGSIVTLMWHAVCPIHDEPHGWRESVWCKLSDALWEELVTPGTPLHGRWEAQVDAVAGFLKQLQEAHVPVLWRPYHEMNGDWFWWCDRPGNQGYVALWRNMFHRLVDHHRLDNLLWVWNVNYTGVGAYADYYPGHAYVDALACDVYRSDYKQAYYDALLALGQGKPIALGEVGKIPTPDILARQPRWTWFMTWSNLLVEANAPEEVRVLYDDPRTLTRDQRDEIHLSGEGTAGGVADVEVAVARDAHAAGGGEFNCASVCAEVGRQVATEG